MFCRKYNRNCHLDITTQVSVVTILSEEALQRTALLNKTCQIKRLVSNKSWGNTLGIFVLKKTLRNQRT